MGIETVRVMLRRGHLRWFGQVERRDNEERLKKCTKVQWYGSGQREDQERDRKRLREDIKKLGLTREMAFDRKVWSRAIRRQEDNEPLWAL